jgi:hypothetical protein
MMRLPVAGVAAADFMAEARAAEASMAARSGSVDLGVALLPCAAAATVIEADTAATATVRRLWELLLSARQQLDRPTTAEAVAMTAMATGFARTGTLLTDPR